MLVGAGAGKGVGSDEGAFQGARVGAGEGAAWSMDERRQLDASASCTDDQPAK